MRNYTVISRNGYRLFGTNGSCLSSHDLKRKNLVEALQRYCADLGLDKKISNRFISRILQGDKKTIDLVLGFKPTNEFQSYRHIVIRNMWSMLTTNNFYRTKVGCDKKVHRRSGVFTNMVLKAMTAQNQPVSIDELITITHSETRKKRIWNALATLAHYDIVDRVQSDGCNKWFVKK